MNTTELFTGVFGLFLLCVLALASILWVFVPFMILGINKRLDRLHNDLCTIHDVMHAGIQDRRAVPPPFIPSPESIGLQLHELPPPPPQ